VTGGTLGIGRACAELLARRGYTVVAAGLDDEHLAALRRASAGPRFVAADVTDALAVERLVEECVARHGGLDVVVNSAGIQRYGTVADTDEATWDAVLATNVKAAFLVCRAAVPHLRRRGAGAIVNVSSVQAFAAQPGAAAYVTSKGALNALTRALAADHAAEGIRANAVCPGSVDTPMLRWAAALHGGDDAEALLRTWGALHPVGRIAAPEEVAEVVAFLAGPQSSFITGAAVPVDGGLSAVVGVTLPDDEQAGADA